MREHLRILLLATLIYFLISDIIELASYIPATSISLAPLLRRLLPIKRFKDNALSKVKTEEGVTDPVLKKLNLAHGIGSSTIISSRQFTRTSSSHTPDVAQPTELSTTETEEIIRARQNWLKAMQEHCLPKLVCELHASLTGQNSLSDAEVGILTAIKETSLGTSAEVVSKYHFAAHMGQLLAGVEGTGCHNFYTNCPIAKTQVLNILKKVKLR